MQCRFILDSGEHYGVCAITAANLRRSSGTGYVTVVTARAGQRVAAQAPNASLCTGVGIAL